MKKLFSIIVFAFIALNMNAQDTTEGAVMTFEKETIKYGTIKKGDDGTRVFKFENTGTTPLKITNVKATCGCTVPTFPKNDIMPGEKGEISIKYDTSKIGRFSKSVSVFTNTSRKRIPLRVAGNVVAHKKKIQSLKIFF